MAKRAPICCFACPASSPETLTPAIRTPFGIRFDGPAEGASAIAAQRTSSVDSAARFQSDMRTNEAATRFTSQMVRPKAGFCEKVPGAGLEPARPRGGHLILSQARITSFATPAVQA